MDEEQLQELTQQIINYANKDKQHGWHTVRLKGKTFRFPKRALIHYVFGNMHPLRDLLPPYEAFSPWGLKLMNDNRFHTDVWLGAGFDIDNTYSHSSVQSKALNTAVVDIEEEFSEEFTFDFTIIANGFKSDKKYYRGKVYEYEPMDKDCWSNIHINSAKAPEDEWDELRCIVIPHAGIEYDLAARNADIIITEVGGKLAHLSIVSREKGKLLIRVSDACKRFPPFSQFSIDLEEMTLKPRDR